MIGDVPRKPCRRCGHPTRADRLVGGYGPACAKELGLTGGIGDRGDQTGPDLFDAYTEDDECDGWDRPADRH